MSLGKSTMWAFKAILRLSSKWVLNVANKIESIDGPELFLSLAHVDREDDDKMFFTCCVDGVDFLSNDLDRWLIDE